MYIPEFLVFKHVENSRILKALYAVMWWFSLSPNVLRKCNKHSHLNNWHRSSIENQIPGHANYPVICHWLVAEEGKKMQSVNEKLEKLSSSVQMFALALVLYWHYLLVKWWHIEPFSGSKPLLSWLRSLSFQHAAALCPLNLSQLSFSYIHSFLLNLCFTCAAHLS